MTDALEDARAALAKYDYDVSIGIGKSGPCIDALSALITEHERLTEQLEATYRVAADGWKKATEKAEEVRTLIAERERMTAPPSQGVWSCEKGCTEPSAACILDHRGRKYTPPADREACGDYPAPCNCDDPETHDGALRRQGPITDEWEYKPGWIDADGRVFAQSGVIAPGYVKQFMAEGGEVIRRRVGKFETVEAARDAS